MKKEKNIFDRFFATKSRLKLALIAMFLGSALVFFAGSEPAATFGGLAGLVALGFSFPKSYTNAKYAEHGINRFEK